MTNYKKRIINGMKYKIGGLCFRSLEEIANHFLVDIGTVEKWIERKLPASNGHLVTKITYKQSRERE